ncbi:IS21 family transposase, partial [Legionella pneumophila]
WYAGRSKSELADSLGVDRKTIRKYLAPAEAAGMTPGGAAMAPEDWAVLIKGWVPELADRRLRQVTLPEIDKHRDYIKSLLGTVTVSTIHQRLWDEHGLSVSVSSLRRSIAAMLPEETRRSQVTVLRDEVEPGLE